MNSQAQQANSEQSPEQRRRRRKERAAKSRAPEPKNVVSGAGQPLDPGVRRELEEQLGHDLSRVRLHTGRDAGQLTQLLGADAVAVGQDILFAEGAFKPGTDQGRRLLAHELLHTVQNPHGLGALRVGREAGAVSLPQQSIEREAENAAQSLVRPEQEESAPEVQEGQSTPGWLRYATLDADRRRTEAIDPATLVDRLTNSVVRSLRGDPEDLSKRTRKQLAGLPEELLDQVLDRLDHRLLGSEQDRVLDLVDEIDAYDDFADDRVERDAHDAPEIEPDAAEEVRSERESAQRSEAEERARQDKPASAPGPEKERADHEGAPGSTPANGGTRQEQRQQSGAEPRGGGARSSSGAGQREAVAAAPGGGANARGGQGAQAEEKAQAQGADQGRKKEEGAKETGDQQGVTAAGAEESAARNRPGAAEQFVTGRQVRQEDKRGSDQPTGSPAVGRDTELPAPSSRLDGVRNQDLDGPEESGDELAAESDNTSEVEVGGGEKSAWDTKLQPEDFLPEQDPDLSGVPTADARQDATPGSESLPDFPAPPVTKADQVQAERDAEDAEDASAEAEADSEDDTVEEAAAEPSTSRETEGGPGDTLLTDLGADHTVTSPPDTGAVSKDPKHGDDPKAGPVTAQTTVQQAPGAQDGGRSEGSGAAKENAAKEEKGTPAAGDRAAAGQEKNSPQAVGGTAAAPAPKSEQQQAPSAAAAGTEPTDDSRAPSAARDSHITGGSGADRPGGSTSGSQSGAAPEADRSPSDRSAAPKPAPARATAPAPEPPTSAPMAADAEPAPKAERAPGTAAPKASQAPASGATGGGVASKPAGKGKGRKDSGPAPNLSQVSPEAGLSTAAGLKPHKALEAMGGVGGSVDRTVGDEHKQLAAAPPSMQRPAGAPQTLEGKPKTDAPAQYSQDPAQKSEAPEQENAEVAGAKQPEGQIEAEKAEEPSGWQTFKMALGFGIGWLAEKLGFKVDKQELAAKFAGLPTKDEALKQAQAGNAPGVQMQGAADQTAGEQGSAVDAKGQETVDTARDDSGRSMGEDQVYPDAPQEQLKGKVPGADGAKAAAPGKASTGAVPPDAASAVAEHDRGPEFQAAFSQGQKGMSDGRQTKDKDFRDSQQKHRQQVDGEVDKNTRDQAGERTKALDEVTAQRADWRKEQDQELQKLGTEKTERSEKLRKDVEDREKKTDDDVSKQKTDSDKQIKDKGDQAETDAKAKTDGAAKDSGNWLTKAFDWIKEKVIEIKNAIVRIIRDARDAVVGFIKNFKETVERWINEARKFIVDTVKNLINDLIEFAKAMVRAVIELAARIRKFITNLIAAAIAFVTRLAARLKQIVTDLLNALAKMLSDILNILKKMLTDVIRSVIDAIKTILDYASKLLGAFGEFMMIAIDFLDDPGGWLSGAKNSAVDGAKNHLFREVQAAVKQWFQSKIEEIIGVPKAIIDKLIKGGFTLERIVKETWDAVVPQLPFIIGEIVITKVIAKLIPGAGWVTAVIDAIRTAIGALGEILRAMGAVLAWLRAVRQGGAGILFAKAVAAGIVALLELAYQALLDGIGKYVAKVGRRLKGVAAKLGGFGKEGPGRGRPAAGAADADAPRGNRPTEKAPAERPTTRPKDTGAGPGRPKDARPASENTGAPARPKANEPGTTRPVGKPDTRPTPSPRPKPEPAPRPKPKPEPDTKPKHADDKAPDKPKDATPDKPKDGKETPATTKPRDPEGATPGSPKGDEPGRPREEAPGKPEGDGRETPPKRTDDKDAPGKPRPKDGKDASGKPKEKPDKDGPDKPKRKPDEDGPGRPKSKPGDKGPRKPRPRHEKSGPGRPKPRREKDRRKKDENSKKSKEERLAKIVARLRPKLYGVMRHGVRRSLFLPLLRAMRLRYRLTDLAPVGGDPFTVVATLNPSMPVLDGDYSQPRSEPDAYSVPPGAPAAQDDLPKPKLPAFHNGRAGAISAEFLSQPKVPWGTEAGAAPRGKPDGWNYVTDPSRRLQAGGAWVRAHLLPSRLGGLATGNNLVPARRGVNKGLELGVEMPAWNVFEKPKPIWYESRVKFGFDAPVDEFPSYIRSTFGQYRKIRGTGAQRGDWQRTGAEKTVGLNLKPPQSDERKKLYINSYGATTIGKWLKVKGSLADHIVKQRALEPGGVYAGFGRFKKALRDRKAAMGHGAMPNLEIAIANLETLITKRKVDWDPLHEEL